MTDFLAAVPWPEALAYWVPGFLIGIGADRVYLSRKARTRRSAQ